MRTAAELFFLFDKGFPFFFAHVHPFFPEGVAVMKETFS
jgi:hypothetical protein